MKYNDHIMIHDVLIIIGRMGTRIATLNESFRTGNAAETQTRRSECVDVATPAGKGRLGEEHDAAARQKERVAHEEDARERKAS